MNKNKHIVLWFLLGILLSGHAFSQDEVVCEGDLEDYGVSSIYPYNSIFSWNVEGGTIVNDFGKRIEVKWDGDAEEGRITVQEIGIGGCEGELKEYVVDIHNTFADLGMDAEICEGESIEFSPGTNYDSYEWQDGSSQSYYVADSTGAYWVEVNDEYGCTDIDTVHLTVHDNPDVNIEASTMYPDKVHMFEDSLAFVAGEVEYVTLDAGMWSSYEWNTGDMMASIDVEDTDVAKATDGAKTRNFWVTVQNEYGCSATDSIAITVVGGLRIPNAITPNGDQANNLWKIPGLALYPNCEVQIFDRWGSLVYQSRGYGQADYWDGTRQNGTKLPMDSYYYIIKLGNGEEPIYGTVSIIR